MSVVPENATAASFVAEPTLFPLLTVRDALNPTTRRRVTSGARNSRGAPARNLVFEDDRGLIFSPLGHLPSLRQPLDECANRVAEHVERAFCFPVATVDPWIVVTAQASLRLLAYRAAMRGASGVLICRISLSATNRCVFPGVEAAACDMAAGDALIFSGTLLCKETAPAAAPTVLVTVLRRAC